MRRLRVSLAAVSALLLFVTCARKAPVFPRAPVVLISIDTLRADHLPVYGYHAVETSALDALARDAVVFDNAVSHVPLTLPSHVSLFTGLLPFQHGVRDNIGYRLEKAHSTLATYLRGRGYATGGAVSAFVLALGGGRGGVRLLRRRDREPRRLRAARPRAALGEPDGEAAGGVDRRTERSRSLLRILAPLRAAHA